MDYILHESKKYETVFTLQENIICELFDYEPLGDTYLVNKPDYKEKYYQFLLNYGKYFYNLPDWIQGVSDCDFSFSRKMHGAIPSILAGVPTFVVAPDMLRVGGICEHHKIPFIPYAEFDVNMKPIEHYYELADFTDFNKNYPINYDNFLDFCRKNGVALKIDKMRYDEKGN
jgi:hypothetical protein